MDTERIRVNIMKAPEVIGKNIMVGQDVRSVYLDELLFRGEMMRFLSNEVGLEGQELMQELSKTHWPEVYCSLYIERDLDQCWLKEDILALAERIHANRKSQAK